MQPWRGCEVPAPQPATAPVFGMGLSWALLAWGTGTLAQGGSQRAWHPVGNGFVQPQWPLGGALPGWRVNGALGRKVRNRTGGCVERGEQTPVSQPCGERRSNQYSLLSLSSLPSAAHHNGLSPTPVTREQQPPSHPAGGPWCPERLVGGPTGRRRLSPGR